MIFTIIVNYFMKVNFNQTTDAIGNDYTFTYRWRIYFLYSRHFHAIFKYIHVQVPNDIEWSQTQKNTFASIHHHMLVFLKFCSLI